MNKPFDMYSWRRKYIHLAENDTEVNEALMGAQDAIEKFYVFLGYNPGIGNHSQLGKCTSFSKSTYQKACSY